MTIDPRVVLIVNVQYDALLNQTSADEIALWFRRAFGGYSSLPGVGCFTPVGPGPRIQRTLHPLGWEITAAWVANIDLACFRAPTSAPAPDSPAPTSEAEIAAGIATAMTSIRQALYDQATHSAGALGSNFGAVRVSSTAFSPAVNGDYNEWVNGNMARSSPTQSAGQWWLGLTNGDTSTAQGAPRPQTPGPIDGLLNTLKQVAIWGGAIAVTVIAGPPLYRAVRDMEQAHALDHYRRQAANARTASRRKR